MLYENINQNLRKKCSFCKKGFTLAEILIVLVVIGVITAILLPVAIQSSPDENVMKFKKGNATLGKVISELVNSDEYYADGDLGRRADGQLADDSSDLCKSFGDIVTTKQTKCTENITGSATSDAIVALHWEKTAAISRFENDNNSASNYVDRICKEAIADNVNYINTSDDIYFYDPYPFYTFAMELPTFNGGSCKQTNKSGIRNWFYCITDCTKTSYGMTPESCVYDNVISTYKIFCMDIDEIGKGEDPFGYGLRVDGKIFLGARAKEWMKKSIQKGDS